MCREKESDEEVTSPDSWPYSSRFDLRAELAVIVVHKRDAYPELHIASTTTEHSDSDDKRFSLRIRQLCLF